MALRTNLEVGVRYLPKVLLVTCLALQTAMAVEKVFGVYPRTVISPAIASNVAQNVFLPGALNLQFGMKREEVLKTCPRMEYDFEFGQRYFLKGTHPVFLDNQLIGIEFTGGFPTPSREIVSATVEWLLGVFGPPDEAFHKKTNFGRGLGDGRRFGLIWKRTDFAVACSFDSTESGKRFNAFLKLVAPTSNMDVILSSQGGNKLPKDVPSVFTSFKHWSQTSARLESKPPSHATPITSSLARPVVSLEVLEKYEVLSGEGLSGSAFVIRHHNKLYGVCSIHQFDGKAPARLEPLQGAAILLEKAAGIRQKDVQVIPLKLAQPQPEYLTYNPDFTFQRGEEFFVLGPAGGVELGVLTSAQIADGSYRSASGPRQFAVRMAKPFVAAGGSGCPVVQTSTGAVVGVLLSADDGEKARVIEFETLCLPK